MPKIGTPRNVKTTRTKAQGRKKNTALLDALADDGGAGERRRSITQSVQDSVGTTPPKIERSVKPKPTDRMTNVNSQKIYEDSQ